MCAKCEVAKYKALIDKFEDVRDFTSIVKVISELVGLRHQKETRT